MSSSSESTAQAPGDEAAYNEEYLRLPGIRFVPTDRELISHYLRRKLRGEPLPTDLVLDGHDAYAEHPKKLVPKLGEATEGAWYLFSTRDRKYAGGMRPKRDTGDDEGHWKAIEAEKQILGGADGKEVIGAKRGLTFHEHFYEVDALGKRKRAKKKLKPTKWKMVEFVSSNSSRTLGDDTAHDPMLLNDCVLCKITNRSLRAVDRDPAQGDEEENDDGTGEEGPTSDGGGESQEKHLPEQQPAGGSGAGAQGEQQPPPPGDGGSGAQGKQHPATAEALGRGHLAALPHDDYRGAQFFVDVDCSVQSGTNVRSIFDYGDHIGTAYGGGEPLDAQREGHQQAASGGGAGSSPNEQQQPTPEAPNGRGAAAAATAAASEQAGPFLGVWGLWGANPRHWDLCDSADFACST